MNMSSPFSISTTLGLVFTNTQLSTAKIAHYFGISEITLREITNGTCSVTTKAQKLHAFCTQFHLFYLPSPNTVAQAALHLQKAIASLSKKAVYPSSGTNQLPAYLQRNSLFPHIKRVAHIVNGKPVIIFQA